MILEWIIDREQHAIGADCEDRVNQRLRTEIAAGGDMEITAEIIGHGPFRGTIGDPAEAMIEPIDISVFDLVTSL